LSPSSRRIDLSSRRMAVMEGNHLIATMHEAVIR
jgi:hypothetical protein